MDRLGQGYLAGLGVKADELLEKMNSRPQIAACGLCRNFAHRFATVRGVLTKPITLHTKADGLAEINNEGHYRDVVASWGARTTWRRRL